MVAELTTVTQGMKEFRSALRTGGHWSQSKGEVLYLGIFQEVGCDRHLGTGRFYRANEATWELAAEALVWEPEFWS